MKLLKGVESELKYGLTREEYTTLAKAHLGRALSTECHTNFYFDDRHLNLRRLRIGLRIRLVDDKKAVLTLKYPQKSSLSEIRALKVRAEFEAPLPRKLARQIIEGKKDILSLKNLPIKRLSRIYPTQNLCRVGVLGFIKTVRIKAPLNHKFILELDRSTMFGKTFYELEVESNRPKRADKAVHTLFWKFSIDYHPVRRSKLARFIDEWRKRQK